MRLDAETNSLLAPSYELDRIGPEEAGIRVPDINVISGAPAPGTQMKAQGGC
jgi:hypothetical protein